MIGIALALQSDIYLDIVPANFHCLPGAVANSSVVFIGENKKNLQLGPVRFLIDFVVLLSTAICYISLSRESMQHSIVLR